jgi:hypothetical protein
MEEENSWENADNDNPLEWAGISSSRQSPEFGHYLTAGMTRVVPLRDPATLSHLFERAVENTAYGYTFTEWPYSIHQGMLHTR